MIDKNYNPQLKGDRGALKRALYKACGHTEEELRKPIIAIANSYSDATPGHAGFNTIAQQVRRGIEDAGGCAMEFGVIAPCDGIAEGHEGMRYILPSRDLIASSVECMTRAHDFDGIVLLGSCDKIVPGLLMAAARLDKSAIFCNLGPMYPAVYNNRHWDGNIITEAMGWKQRGLIDEKEFKKIEDLAEPCFGSCAMLGTANTMCSVAEALGMSLPGCATVPAIDKERNDYAYESGKAIVELVKKGITGRDIINRKSIENAIRLIMGIGGSTNAIMHLQAINEDAGLPPLKLSEFSVFSKSTPQVASIYPASEYDMVDYHLAGGVPAVLNELKPLLNLDAMTVTGKTIGENLAEFTGTKDENVIRPIKRAFNKEGGIGVLEGNIAPLGAIVKPAAIPEHLHHVTLPARVFDSENEAIDGIMSGDIPQDTCLVLRYEGPKGGPGMPEMYRPMKALEGMGLSNTCALITDGRFSGSNRGCFVGHISPEAYEGGLLAIVEDGDMIELDIENQKIELHLGEETIAKRQANWHRKEKNIKPGYLETYKRTSASAAEGASVR